MGPGPVWTGAGNLATTWIRSPDRPARTGSLYRLSYRGRELDFVPFLFREPFMFYVHVVDGVIRYLTFMSRPQFMDRNI